MKLFRLSTTALACLGFAGFSARGAPVASTAPKATVGRFGAGPLSSQAWFSGSWVNGGDMRLAEFERYRGIPSDSVTQGMPGQDHWYENAGCESEAQVDREFAQSPADFQPALRGVFREASWKSHVWGGDPATAHRKRLIHLGWMNTIPTSVGNGSGRNPKLWRDVREGAGDKYFFLLGRKFAWLDARSGDPAYPVTLDLTYEWTLTTHPSWPGGTYELNGETKEAFRDFPYGWSRLARVFREGYRHQRGQPCNYRFCWRPQLKYSVNDAQGHPVRHERLWPNLAAGWDIPADVIIGGRVVLPKGLLGAQADLVGVSWHDSSVAYVQGGSVTEPSNNWQKIMEGSPTCWGFTDALNFARAQGVPFCFPEWGPVRKAPGKPRSSTHPGDMIRFTRWLIENNLDVVAYENVFDQGSGDLRKTWVPAQPAQQDPLIVYRELWRR